MLLFNLSRVILSLSILNACNWEEQFKLATQSQKAGDLLPPPSHPPDLLSPKPGDPTGWIRRELTFHPSWKGTRTMGNTFLMWGIKLYYNIATEGVLCTYHTIHSLVNMRPWQLQENEMLHRMSLIGLVVIPTFVSTLNSTIVFLF